MKSQDTLLHTTSWQPVSSWYTKSLGITGDYYHRTIVIPKTLNLLHVTKDSSLLDLACGQGILERSIPQSVSYTGVDISSSFIHFAKMHKKNKESNFVLSDITKPLQIQKKDFTHTSIILALQNMQDIQAVCMNAMRHSIKGGVFVIVLNHPCFRIPRQSSWGIDEKKKTEFRRIDRYMSELSIPISANPSQKNSPITWSFHKPLSAFMHALLEAGFFTATIEEWTSDKKSTGTYAKMENRARNEFPMFLAIKAIKYK
jgi:ubiquinone/menaquinone biosynthesis C-methylase UbiE